MAPPWSRSRPSPLGPMSTTLKSRTRPRAMIGSARSSCWRVASVSTPDAASSRTSASRTSPRASATTAWTRWSSRPSLVCWSSNQPTTLTTTADSNSVLATTRAWMERRQRVRARRTPAVNPCVETRAIPASRVARLVAHATHGHHDLGVLGVVLHLRAEPLHMHVDQSGVGGVPVAPDLLEQHLAGEDLPRLARQAQQQVELEGREVDRLVVPG